MIERLKFEDIKELAELYKQLLPVEQPIEMIKATFEKIKDNPNYIILVAKEDGKLIGTALGIICHMLFGKYDSFMVIEDVVVDINYRRKDIGSKLIEALEEVAINSNCKYIMLMVDKDVSTAENFYNTLGYKSEPYIGFKKYLNN